jgi:hypothetical protein
MPAGGAGVRAPDHFLGGGHEPAVPAQVFAVVGQQDLMFVRVAHHGFEASLLIPAGEMEPELEDQGAVVGQHPFEGRDSGEFVFQPVGVEAAFNAPEEHIGIPASVIDADAPRAGRVRQNRQ